MQQPSESTRIGTQRSVLIIEDEQDTRDLYSLLLKQAGYDVVLARNGMEGFTRACESQPSVIVTDLGLPTIDGWEMIRRLRADSRTSHIPVIVVTGWSTPNVQDVAAKLGCASVLTKPCMPDELVGEIQKTINN
jgi:CheY-like chemotaxis protein